jgi:crossover junction endodeoxyribonuclease RusA
MWKHTTSGKHYLVKKVVDYYVNVAYACKVQGAVLRLVEPLSIEVLLYPPDKRVRDMDNAWKVIGDAMTRAGVWQDDSQIRAKHISWAEPIKYGRVCVLVTLIAPEGENHVFKEMGAP